MAIGILHAGELGAALGGRLVAAGTDVVTIAGRSPRTADRAQAAGIRVVDGMDELLATADVLVSVVAPGSAVELAHAVRDAGAGRPGQLFVDANSIAPETVQTIVGIFDDSAISVVDATVHGLAARLETDGTMYVSGAAAERVREALGPALSVRVVGPDPGTASMLKMLLGGVSKGLCGLFAELGVTAHRSGLAGEFVAECERYYPGVVGGPAAAAADRAEARRAARRRDG